MFQKKDRTNRRVGHLYHFSQGQTHTELVVNKKTSSPTRLVPRIVGGGLTSFALAAMMYSYAPVAYMDLGVTATAQEAHISISEEVTTEPNAAQLEAEALGLGTDFSIAIPKIHAYANVTRNVSPSNEEEYSKALREGVAQAEGTGLPGGNKRMFLFAHSTNSLLNFDKYNAIFYELKKLSNDDLIFIYYEGEKHVYKVFDEKVVAATDVSWLAPSDEPILILQTCDPPGTSWKRLLVFAKEVGR